MAKGTGAVRRAKREAALERRLARGRKKQAAKAARRAGPRNRWF